MFKILASALLACTQLQGIAAATKEFDWTISWKTVNPDGMADRLVVAINDQWPLPVVRVSKGDRVIFNVTNKLLEPARNSTIHFHGMYQNGTNDMDGPSMVTQCPTAVNENFIYNFTVDQNGTYWYHTHVDAFYPDGYRQMFIVDDDEPWFEDQVDDELLFTMSDWYHELTEIITERDFLSLYNPTGAEPVPASLLFNETRNGKFLVKPNTTYRMRLTNIGAFSAFFFYMPGQNFTIVEADGIYSEGAEADVLSVATAQRYSVLFTTGPETNVSYPMVMMSDQSLYDVITPEIGLNLTSWLVTDESAECVEYDQQSIYDTIPHGDVSVDDFTTDDIEYFDDSELRPYDQMPLLQNPTKNVTLELTLTNLLNGVNYAFLNEISLTPQKVPTLYSVLSAPDDATANNASIYGVDTNSVVLDYMETVQIVLNNFDSGKHPFHLHGHAFQIAYRAESKGSDDDSDYFPYSEDLNETFHDPPMRRDTVVVEPYSHIVLRFQADNPGVWIFHCHIDWHLTQGLGMLFIEAPTQIRQNTKVPDLSYQSCRTNSVAFEGNAAANTQDFYNLAGQNLQQPDLPAGFTARGIVALVFSVICAFVGMGFLTWYGLSDTPSGEAATAGAILHEDVPENDVQSAQFNDSSSSDRHHHAN